MCTNVRALDDANGGSKLQRKEPRGGGLHDAKGSSPRGHSFRQPRMRVACSRQSSRGTVSSMLTSEEADRVPRLMHPACYALDGWPGSDSRLQKTGGPTKILLHCLCRTGQGVARGAALRYDGVKCRGGREAIIRSSDRADCSRQADKRQDVDAKGVISGRVAWLQSTGALPPA